ncbi:hypothetical protein [Synechococcus sp. UW179A]|uniref:hypothetical protein n=1 Tax=Synechococcus sp. UW179A TaxID=2575510 RepID=UPI001A7E120D|nr:hypothetical protein [Synechococcus sp. UW179A]
MSFKISMPDIAAKVAEDRPSAKKEAKEINPLIIFRETVTDYCAAHMIKSAGICDQYHPRKNQAIILMESSIKRPTQGRPAFDQNTAQNFFKRDAEDLHHQSTAALDEHPARSNHSGKGRGSLLVRCFLGIKKQAINCLLLTNKILN